jgi:membrane AbrB-like protein
MIDSRSSVAIAVVDVITKLYLGFIVTNISLMMRFDKCILDIMWKWALLVAITVAATVPLNAIGVPSAALFAALIVGIVLALASLAPSGVPRRAGIAAQGVLGVYIGTMVHHDALTALGSGWPIVLGVAVATLALSIGAGALLGLNRGISPLTGSLALVAGGASGLVAIARELGGDDRVVAVVQYLRVALITASMPIVVTLVYHAAKSSGSGEAPAQSGSAPWYVSIALLVVIVLVGVTAGRLARLPGSGLLGPMALTIALQLTGSSFGLVVPMALVQLGYAVIGWQAGVAFTRESMRAIGRAMPTALGLIVALNLACAGLGILLAHVTGISPLEGYLSTSPGGIYAVLATAVETGSNVTFVVAAQVVRVLLMLFAAPLLARGLAKLTQRSAYSRVNTSDSREPIRVAD